ncbi:hypothetical protein JDM601_3743 [Mycolicibacter sinensis]|uniref:Uncharacterized protein n=1 Tax=Mycolicibacter sinensis (strain JDM601) TaxID=875328 RepID=F5Z361_MYCSD|nr:hypothetical protein JDM601_3743 [Mycolicibacter sinensis]
MFYALYGAHQVVGPLAFRRQDGRRRGVVSRAVQHLFGLSDALPAGFYLVNQPVGCLRNRQ